MAADELNRAVMPILYADGTPIYSALSTFGASDFAGTRMVVPVHYRTAAEQAAEGARMDALRAEWVRAWSLDALGAAFIGVALAAACSAIGGGEGDAATIASHYFDEGTHYGEDS